MKSEDEKNLDINRLREDMIDYFSTAINPFDVDLKGIEQIKEFSSKKIIKLAENNGFNMKYYIIENENLSSGK